MAQALVVAVVLALLIRPLNSVNRTPASSTTASSTAESSSASQSATNSSGYGLELVATMGPVTPAAGQNVSITISLFNSLSSPLNVLTADELAQGASPPRWAVNGFPVAMWGGCNGLEPVEFMVVRGNYSVGELGSASANSSIYDAARMPFMCAEGGSIRNLEFRPDSSVANATGTFCAAMCSPDSHVWNLTSNFTVSGYWAYPINGSEAADVATPPRPECTSSGIPDCTTFNYPEVGLFAQHAFVPGLYTLAVADEWGQAVVLHFSVRAGTTTARTAPGLPGCAFAKTATFGGVAMDIYVSQAPALGSTVCLYDHVQGTPPQFPEGITFTITNSTDFIFFQGQCVGLPGEPGSCSTSWNTSQSYGGALPAGGSYRLLVSLGGGKMDTGISFILSS